MTAWQPIETMPEDKAVDVDARFLQAAQSVAVVEEPVAWDNFPGYLIDHQEGSIVTEENLQFWLSAFIKNTDYNKPTHSIPAADLATLREKAAQFDSADMEYLLGCKAAYQQELETRTKFQHELNALEQERDELRKDAERYRWLRDGNDNKKSAACHIAVNCYGLEWDDAIDAAIAQGKGE